MVDFGRIRGGLREGSRRVSGGFRDGLERVEGLRRIYGGFLEGLGRFQEVFGVNLKRGRARLQLTDLRLKRHVFRAAVRYPEQPYRGAHKKTPTFLGPP